MSRIPTSAIKVAIFAVITFVVIGVLGTIIANTGFQPTHSYSALFTDATGIEGGETVRLAGVPVGTVTGTGIVGDGDGDARLARIDFTVDRTVPVFAAAHLQLRYENLVGRRYLAVLERPGSGPLMPPGGTFAIGHTQPALNLTALFNGFQPLFAALDPQQINTLSFEIIQTLQGEGGTLAQLLAHTARLTATLGDKDLVIGHVVDNLNAVLTTVDRRDVRLTQLIDQFRDLMVGLARNRDTIDTSLPAISALLDSTDDLLTRSRPPLRTDIGALNSLAGQLADTRATLDDELNRLPTKLVTGTRLVSYGSWANFNLCRLDLRVALFGGHLGLSTPVDASGNDRDTVCGLGRPR
jgi:phospholipid/cholesterol/gamma-HCH transport system substrate-binding protein